MCPPSYVAYGSEIWPTRCYATGMLRCSRSTRAFVIIILKPFQDSVQTSELFNHLAKFDYKTLYKPVRPMMKGITCPVDSMMYTPVIEFHLIMYSIAKTEYMRTHKLTIGQ